MSWDQANQTATEIAAEMLAALPDEVRVRISPDHGVYYINKDELDKLTDVIQVFIAELIAGIIDAGSEAEAVMEEESLRKAIYNEVKGWSNHPDLQETGF